MNRAFIGEFFVAKQATLHSRNKGGRPPKLKLTGARKLSAKDGERLLTVGQPHHFVTMLASVHGDIAKFVERFHPDSGTEESILVRALSVVSRESACLEEWKSLASCYESACMLLCNQKWLVITKRMPRPTAKDSIAIWLRYAKFCGWHSVKTMHG